MQRVSRISLDPITGRTLQLRWRRDQTINVSGEKKPCQTEPGRTGFVGGPHRLRQRPSPRENLGLVRTQLSPEQLASLTIESTTNN
jgi:hypothetical protein